MPGKDGTRHTHTVTEAPPAPAFLLLPQGMGPHAGKEGRHLPTAQPGTAALSSTHRQHLLVPRAPHRKKKQMHTGSTNGRAQRLTHALEHTCTSPAPRGCSSRTKFLGEQEERADSHTHPAADTTGSHLSLPRAPAQGGVLGLCASARHSSALAPGRHVPLVFTTHIKC